MANEADLLAALAAAPADDLLRQVYADWLEENPAPGRAETATAGPERAKGIELRLAELSGGIPHEWAATASKRPLENCNGPQFRYKCPLRWEALAPTDDPTVRFCGSCYRQVYYCKDISTARAFASVGECVAVDVGQPRRPGDLEPEREHLTLGIMLPTRHDAEEHDEPEPKPGVRETRPRRRGR